MKHIIVVTLACLFMIGCLGRGERINIEYEQDRRYDPPRREKKVEHHHHHYKKKPRHHKPRCRPYVTRHYDHRNRYVGYSRRDEHCVERYFPVKPRYKHHRHGYKQKLHRDHKKKHHRRYD